MSSRAPGDLLCAQLEAIFCPSLDPALVAAIAYEPDQTFEQASQVLSQLIPEHDPEHETAESAPSTTSTPASQLLADRDDEDYAPSTPTSVISDTQLSTFLDQWESNTAAHIPADDDPTLHLTDEEDHGYQPTAESDQSRKEDSISQQDPTISFLAHAFPRLPISLLSSTLQSNAGDLTRTLDELVTSQLLADNPDLASIPAPSSEPPSSLGSPQSHDFAFSSKKGLDLDQLAQGSLSLAGKKKRAARKRAAEEQKTLQTGLPSPHAVNQMNRSRSAAGSPVIRLGDIRQRGGGVASERTRDASGGSTGTETRWKDPKDRINVAIPAHLLSEAGIGFSPTSTTASLPNTPFRSTFPEEEQQTKFSPPHENEDEEELRRAAISEALSQVKITSNPNHNQSPPPRASLAGDASSWVVTSSVFNRLVTLLCPIPLTNVSSPSSRQARSHDNGRNPPLFSEKEASAVHARSAFVLSRTTSRLIRRSAETFDTYHQDSLGQIPEVHAAELGELGMTIAALSGTDPRRALIALKATGGMNEDGGDPSAALDLLELWSAVGVDSEEESSGAAARKSTVLSNMSEDWTEVIKPLRTKHLQHHLDAHRVAEDGDDEGGDVDGFQPNDKQKRKSKVHTVGSRKSGHGGRSPFSGKISQLDHDLEKDEDAETKPYAGAIVRVASAMKPSSRSSAQEAIDVYSLPTLAEAAQVASTRKAAAALSQQRRVAQTAASVVKRDPVMTASSLGPAAAAQQARDAMTREKLANAHRAAIGSTAGGAMVLPASAGVVQLDDDEHDWVGHADRVAAGRGVLGDLLARRQRALDRLDYASQMESEYRAKRVDALRKAGVAFRGGGGTNVRGAAAAGPLGVVSKDRAEIPGSATYFGQPEPPRNPAPLPADPGSSAGALPLAAIPSTSSYGASLAPSSHRALRGSAAFYYADEARRLDSKARSWGLKAAQALVEERKLALALNRATTAAMSGGGPNALLPSSTSYSVTNRERNVIDLHLLTTGEALAVVREEVGKWWACTPRGGSASNAGSAVATTATMQSNSGKRTSTGSPYIGFGPGPLYIITGIGKHSRGNVAVLRPAVCGWLRRGGWDYEEDAPRGRIVVKGYRGVA